MLAPTFASGSVAFSPSEIDAQLGTQVMFGARALRGQHRSQQAVTDFLRPVATDEATPKRRQQTCNCV